VYQCDPVQSTQTDFAYRAYIAASRRSDRSLEARVESARRASEIHKRRTGRSLRVTEQDVINEEMYEEEDDDLPLQYRRLTAHLQTGSADFNRRLAAYLTNQVAMRSAMEQMAHGNYGQYQPGMYPGNPNMFPSPMLPQQQGMAQSPSQYQRPAPYPSPHHPNFRQAHGRAYSVQNIPTVNGSTSPAATTRPNPMDRRMSTPASAHPDLTSGQALKTEGVKPDPDYLRQTQSATLPQAGSHSYPPMWQDMGPFTTSLPPESQQMLAHAPGFDMNDPNYAMLMHGSEQYVNSPYYPWQGMHSGIKGMPVHPSAYQGMSATLAPAVLDNSAVHTPKHTSTTASTPTAGYTSASVAGESTLPTAGLDFNFSQETKDPGYLSAVSGMPTSSGQATPAGEGFWENFVWEDQHDNHSAPVSNAGSVAAVSAAGDIPSQ
jgi:hypothetical protein